MLLAVNLGRRLQAFLESVGIDRFDLGGREAAKRNGHENARVGVYHGREVVQVLFATLAVETPPPRPLGDQDGALLTRATVETGLKFRETDPIPSNVVSDATEKGLEFVETLWPRPTSTLRDNHGVANDQIEEIERKRHLFDWTTGKANHLELCDGFFQLVKERKIATVARLVANLVRKAGQPQNHVHWIFLPTFNVVGRPTNKRVENARLLEWLQDQEAVCKVFTVGRVVVKNTSRNQHSSKSNNLFCVVVVFEKENRPKVEAIVSAKEKERLPVSASRFVL